MLTRIWILLCGILSIQVSVFGQSYPLGLNPPSLDWQKIETDHVSVIFPSQSEYQAQRIANMVEVLADSNYYSLGDKKKKVSIILQNQTVRSNGFVTVGPFRSEFYTNAPQNNFAGSTDWVDLLTIHEYRHVEQFTNANRGVTKLAGILFGQNGWGLFAGMAMPRWFFEGDAVYYETLLSDAGRGRMPHFENDYKALVLDGVSFNYEKASANSIRDFVPNHYNMGYLMTTYVRNKYGIDVWKDVVNDATRYKGLIYPFNRSLKKHTGMRSPTLYRDMMQSLREEWENDLNQVTFTKHHTATASRKRTFTNYRNPVLRDDGSIIAEKNSFEEIPSYYLIDQRGNEERLLQPGIYSEENATLDFGNKQLLWTETRWDPRWANKTYSVIMLYDLETGSRRKLTQKTRYFSPKMAKDGRKIAAIYSPDDQRFEMHLIDTKYGTAYKKIAFGEDVKAAFPEWIAENKIAFIYKKEGKNAIAVLDLEQEKFEVISPLWTDQISYLEYNSGKIFFSAIFTGIDNIFVMDVKTGKISQVTSSKFGATQPSVNPSGTELAYVDFTPEGYDLVKTNLSESTWKEIPEYSPTKIDFYQPGDIYGSILDSIPSTKNSVSNFKMSEGLFQVHSWYPLFFPPNFSFELNADNIMSTFSAHATANYNVNEDQVTYSGGATYGERFFVFDAEYSTGNRSRYVPVYSEQNIDTDSAFASLNVFSQDWQENSVSFGVLMPLNSSFGNFFGRFWLGTYYHHKWVDYVNDELGTDENFGAFETDLNFYLLQRTARKHIYPRWGISANLNSQSTLSTEVNDARIFSGRARLYFPGLWPTHNFFLNYGYQSEDFTSQYKFQNNFFFSRGYQGIINDRIHRLGFNYALPLLYPDLALGPFIFIKRIKADIFYDYTYSPGFSVNVSELYSTGRKTFSGEFSLDPEILRSVGAELTFDFRFLRLLDMDLGVRCSYLLDDQADLSSTQFDFIIRTIGY